MFVKEKVCLWKEETLFSYKQTTINPSINTDLFKRSSWTEMLVHCENKGQDEDPQYTAQTRDQISRVAVSAVHAIGHLHAI